MLVLARKVDQSIVLGNDISVRVERIDVGGNGQKPSVRLSVQAPPEVTIWRGELYEEKLKEGTLKKKGT